jgi:CRP-like cAMP-binding protein
MLRKRKKTTPPDRSPGEPQNHLLAALPRDLQTELKSRMSVVSLDSRKKLYEPNEPIKYVYFPISGVMSLLAVMDDGSAVEVGTIGNEGMVGIPVFLGTMESPGRAVQQVPGSAWRMPVEAFVAEIQGGGPLPELLRRYTQAVFVQVSQSTACNRLHPAEERLARWLLQTHDRVEADEFSLTHEFLGQMLGVRRATVTVVAGALQKAGIIEYKRGIVTILDRERLEEASCECYRIIRDEYDRLMKLPDD